MSLVGWIQKAARSASVFLRRFEKPKWSSTILSRGLAKSASTIVQKAICFALLIQLAVFQNCVIVLQAKASKKKKQQH